MKDIVCIDVETTGLDPKNDYIIQLAACKIDGKTLQLKDRKTYFIIPQHKYTIDPKAEAVHHINKETLEELGVSLKSIANEFLDFIGDSDYLSYNGNQFDYKFLCKDFALAGFEFPIEGRKFYDSFAMECRFSPRNLSAVYKKYMGRDMIGAHDAASDVLATIDIFREQLNSQRLTLDEISLWNENNLLSPDGSIRDAAGPGEPRRIVFAVGKYKDSEFYKICQDDPSYIKWWGENVASNYTKRICREYCKQMQELINESKKKKTTKKNSAKNK